MKGTEAIQMRRDRTVLIADAKAILDKVQAEERKTMTTDEEKRFDKLHAEAERLLASAERIELHETRERQAAERWLANKRGGTGTEPETAEDTGDGLVLSRGESAATRLRTLGLGDESYQGLTLGNFLRSIVLGPRTDTEKRALSEGTDSAGGFTVPTQLLGESIDKLRAATTVFKAGARTVLLNTDKTSIARLATDPTATWKVENAQLSDNSPTFERIVFDAQSLMSIVLLSREVLEDSVNIERMLAQGFAGAFAVKLDAAALLGSGTPPEPQGIFGASGIGSVSMGAAGATLAATSGYAKIVDLMQALADANAAPPTALIMAPRTQAQIAKLADTTTQPLNPPAMVAAIPQMVTTTIPVNQVVGGSGAVCSSIIAGDFSQLYVGIRTQMRIEVLKERYADYLQYGLLCYMRADVQLAHPASFAKLIGII